MVQPRPEPWPPGARTAARPAGSELRWEGDPTWLRAAIAAEATARQRRGEVLRELETRRVQAVVVEGENVEVLVKEFEERGAASRVRRLLGLSRADREWHASGRLGRAGVPHVGYLVRGRTGRFTRHPRDVLVAPFIPEARTLEEVAIDPSGLTACARRALSRDLGRLIARLHAAGLVHRDLHPGNILVTPHGELLLIDLHRVRSRRWEGPRGTERDLTDLAHFFLTRSSRADRLRLLKTYWGEVGRLRPPQRAATRRLGEAALQSLRRFLRRRERRAMRSGRDYRRAEVFGLTGFMAREPLASRTLDLLLSPTGEDFGLEGELLHSTSSSRILCCRTARGPVCVKIYEEPGIGGLAKRLWRGSRGQRAWLGYQRLALRGVPVPFPLLYLEEAWYSPRRRSLVVTRFVEDAPHLKTYLADSPDHPQERREVLRRLARALRRLHDLALRDRDLKAENILVDRAGPNALVIDPDGVAPLRPGDRHTVAADLARLNASFPHPGPVAPKERLRFLDDYLTAGLTPPPDRSVLRRDIVRLTSAKWQLWEKRST
ncbi:MAG: lipopolysaccharide kinase InaA family protein [Planctomycetota bacterium]